MFFFTIISKMVGLYDLVKKHSADIAKGDTTNFYTSVGDGFDLNADDFVRAQRELVGLGVDIVETNTALVTAYIDGQVALGKERDKAYNDIRGMLRDAKDHRELPQEVLTSLVVVD